MRRCFFAIVAALTLIVSGCSSPRDRISQYPPPIFDTRPAARPRVVKPAPTLPPAPSPLARSLSGRTIVVDAGHGGKDPGALGVGPQYEKQVNLSVAGRLSRLLENLGARVVMTRADDRFIELDSRAAIAERHRADLFISIHADSAENASASGTTVYIARSASRTSEVAAEQITSAFRQAGLECRGVHRANYRVLVGHSRPAVLVECGFLTNPRDAQMLSTSSYQDTVANAISRGVLACVGH